MKFIFSEKFTQNITQWEQEAHDNDEELEYALKLTGNENDNFKTFTATFMFDLSRHVAKIPTLLTKMDAVLTKHDEVLNELSEMKVKVTELEDKVTELEEKITSKNNELEALKKSKDQTENTIKRLEEAALNARNECNALERHSRESSIRVFNIKEEPKENPVDTIDKTKQIIKRISGIDIQVEFGHRVSKYERGKNRPVILRFVSRFQKLEVLKHRSQFFEAGYPIYEDLTKMDLEEKKRHAAEMKIKYEAGARVSFHKGKWWVDGRAFNSE